jgi:hypothetical protein
MVQYLAPALPLGKGELAAGICTQLDCHSRSLHCYGDRDSTAALQAFSIR